MEFFWHGKGLNQIDPCQSFEVSRMGEYDSNWMTPHGDPSASSPFRSLTLQLQGSNPDRCQILSAQCPGPRGQTPCLA